MRRGGYRVLGRRASGKSLLVCVSTLVLLAGSSLEIWPALAAIGAVDTQRPRLRTLTVRPSDRVKIAEQKGVKRPLEEATAEGDKITAAVTDEDLDAPTTKEERCSAKRLTARWPAR